MTIVRSGKSCPSYGMTVPWARKGGALVLAVRGGSNDPLLVSQDYGKGRTLAFGGDTTCAWHQIAYPNVEEGIALHARFWRQVVLWLAKQDEAEGSVWVKPNGADGFGETGLHGRAAREGGVDAADASFDVTVLDPQGVEIAVATAQDNKVVFLEDRPGRRVSADRPRTWERYRRSADSRRYRDGAIHGLPE